LALEVQRPRLAAGANLLAHRDVVGLAVGVDDLEVHHVHPVARHLQADRLEAAFGAADLDHVPVRLEPDLLTAELLPARLRRRRRQAEANEGSDKYRYTTEPHDQPPIARFTPSSQRERHRFAGGKVNTATEGPSGLRRGARMSVPRSCPARSPMAESGEGREPHPRSRRRGRSSRSRRGGRPSKRSSGSPSARGISLPVAWSTTFMERRTLPRSSKPRSFTHTSWPSLTTSSTRSGRPGASCDTCTRPSRAPK